MPRTVADQFADILTAAGTKRAYGIVGDGLDGLRDTIRRQGKTLHARHGKVAA
jgi:pyruvate dehydrogenase (quinone)